MYSMSYISIVNIFLICLILFSFMSELWPINLIINLNFAASWLGEKASGFSYST